MAGSKFLAGCRFYISLFFADNILLLIVRIPVLKVYLSNEPKIDALFKAIVPHKAIFGY
jgi:hypothetical protein